MTYDEILDAVEASRYPDRLAELVPANEFYFAVCEDLDDGGENEEPVFIVTPKSLWDVDHAMCDQSSADMLVEGLGQGFHNLTESTYEFEGGDAAEGIRRLEAAGFIHLPEIGRPEV